MIFRRNFWSEERNLTSLLVILAVYHLALPLAFELGFGTAAGAICLGLLAVSGVLTAFRSWYLRLAVRAVALAAVLTSWWELSGVSPAVSILGTIVDASLVGFLMAAVAAQVFRAGPVTAHRIRGAVVVYLLLGVLFGFLYETLVLLDPDAIRLTNGLDTSNLDALRRELNFFSFVTLTTVGYGDITPVSAFARSLATLEAICGQLYIAITLARLVSNQRSADGDGER
jgi:hypothetical protein